MESKAHYGQNRNWPSIAGLILLLVPICIWMLWISIFSSNPSATQADKVKIFLSYFPTFLRSTSSISLITIVSALGSIVLTILGRKRANEAFTFVGVFIIIIASLILLLQLFSML